MTVIKINGNAIVADKIVIVRHLSGGTGLHISFSNSTNFVELHFPCIEDADAALEQICAAIESVK